MWTSVWPGGGRGNRSERGQQRRGCINAARAAEARARRRRRRRSAGTCCCHHRPSTLVDASLLTTCNTFTDPWVHVPAERAGLRSGTPWFALLDASTCYVWVLKFMMYHTIAQRAKPVRKSWISLSSSQYKDRVALLWSYKFCDRPETLLTRHAPHKLVRSEFGIGNDQSRPLFSQQQLQNRGISTDSHISHLWGAAVSRLCSSASAIWPLRCCVATSCCAAPSTLALPSRRTSRNNRVAACQHWHMMTAVRRRR
jgi:hypothetical protein